MLTSGSVQVDATFAANSGHPGAPMGMAPVAHILFNKFMTFNPKNPEWLNRDRFVLSYVLYPSIERLLCPSLRSVSSSEMALPSLGRDD